MFLLTTLGFLASIAVSSAVLLEVPEGYVLEVTHTCTDGQTDASVSISSDLEVQYRAVCKFDNINGTLGGNDVTTSFSVKYSGGAANDGDCYFDFNANTGVYRINLELFWGEPGTTAFLRQSEYVVTCTTGNHTDVATGQETVEKSPFLPPHIIEHDGETMAESVTLTLVDIRGTDITGNVPFGRKVQLKGSSTVPIVPVDCKAISGSDEHYFLRSGCGDGVIIRADKGFNTDSTDTTSPIFTMFQMSTNTISFECKFIKCNASCDGSSCTDESRRKRAVSQDDFELPPEVGVAKTKPILQFDDKIANKVKTDDAVLILPLPLSKRSSELSPCDFRFEDDYFRNLLVFYLLLFLLVLAVFSILISMFACFRSRSVTPCKCQNFPEPSLKL